MRREVADTAAAETPDSKHVTTDHDKKEGEYGYKWGILYVPRWAQKRRRTVSGSANAVYDALASCADLTFDALGGPSYGKIVEATGVQLGRIAFYINELIAAVMIKRVQRRRTGTKYEIIRSEAHAADEELLRPKPILEAKRYLKRYKKARKARAKKSLGQSALSAFSGDSEKKRLARFEKKRLARFDPPDTLSLLPSSSLPPSFNHQHQAHPLTEVSASTGVKNPPTTDDDDSGKVGGEAVQKLSPPSMTMSTDDQQKVQILKRARMDERVALDLVKSADGQATPLAGYQKLLTLIPPKYKKSAGGWWRYALPRWETYGPDEAGQRIEEHQAKAATRPRVDEGELQRLVMKFIATLDDATLRQRWDAALKQSHFSKAMLENLRLYSTDMMRRCYSAGAGAIYEIFAEQEEA